VFAELYQRDGLKGGHVIMLGPGNEEAARSALRAFPGGMHIAAAFARITPKLARCGRFSRHRPSWVFRDGHMDQQRLAELVKTIGKDRLVLDLSCRRRGDDILW